VAELAAGCDPLRRGDLASLRPFIFEVLAAHRGLVAGAGVITAPGLLADAPRWLEWWWMPATGAPEALRVNLDPSAPDFYDYTTAEWFDRGPDASAYRLVGPYVDHACTAEYTLTLSTPIRSAAAWLGVTAADVLATSLERRVIPALTGISRPVALVSADGRVIASNSPRWPPGLRVPAHSKPLGPPPRRGQTSPFRSWRLTEVADPSWAPAAAVRLGPTAGGRERVGRGAAHVAGVTEVAPGRTPVRCDQACRD
jgi:hypothetical protein